MRPVALGGPIRKELAMCLSGGVAPCFQQPLVSQSRPVFVAPPEPSLQGTYTPLPTIDYSREASRVYYPEVTEPSVMHRLLERIGKPYEPPITLGSKFTLSDMDPRNIPVALGSEVTFKSLRYGRATEDEDD
jgi:hypothetical protein